MNLVDGLNNKQKEAVLKTEGPLLIIAGAGSGKTSVVTKRIAYLLNEKNVPGFRILAITFTNKAAKEMKERVLGLVGEKGIDVQISTFHAFGAKLLRYEIENLGYERNFTIIDTEDKNTVIKRIIKSLNLDPKQYSFRKISADISKAKNEMIGPKEYSKFANNPYNSAVYEIYKKYQKQLKDSNAVDFDDLLILPIELFNKYPEILKKYQNRFRYISVDEYQDTNGAQYLLVKMLSAFHKNICVVGDSDQSIYSWRGANYENIYRFEKDYEECETIFLEQNYRSTKKILEAANQVIKNNTNRKEKKLWTDNVNGDGIKYYRAIDEKDESEYVVKEIMRYRAKGIPFNEMVILGRTNAQSRVFEEKLLSKNIPYKIVGSVEFFRRKEIKDLVAYLTIIANSKSNVSVTRVINVPKRQIGTQTINKLSAYADNNDISIMDAIDDEFMSNSINAKLQKFKEMIDELKNLSSEMVLTDFVDLVLDKTEYRKMYQLEGTLEADIRLENLEEFKSVTKAFEERSDEPTLNNFLEEQALISDLTEHKDTGEEDKITVMTMHAAKGLEFEVVFLVGFEEGLFPHSNSIMEEDKLEEERRLAYVSITRAKTFLHISNAEVRLMYGNRTANMPSRFIDEMGLITSRKRTVSKTVKYVNKKELMYNDSEDIDIGQRIKHSKFGVGIVVKKDGDIIDIAFKAPYGVKKLSATHKSIEKI